MPHKTSMNMIVALRLAYVVLTLSIMAAVAQVVANVMHIPLTSSVAKSLMIAGYMWPLALYAAAVYRRKLKADEEKAGI